MEDTACVAFLQWALPRLGLRWAGFRRVRRQVGKRVDRRLRALGLADVAAYRAHLETCADEWRVLDDLCRIPISRFWRDRGVFAHLGEVVLPDLARAAAVRGEGRLRCWSAGCASGEEPYSLAIAWVLAAAARSPPVAFEVVATDADGHLLERARAARYGAGSLRELPPAWRERAFAPWGADFVLRAEIRDHVALLRQDVREEAPPGRFDLVLCRNLAFTYFDEPVQRGVVRRIAVALEAGGALVVGAHERLPAGAESHVSPSTAKLGIYRKRGA